MSQIKRFYLDLGIDLDGHTLVEDPTLLRHEPLQHEKVLINYFVLLGANEDEQDQKLKQHADQHGLERSKRVARNCAGMLNGFSIFYQKITIAVTEGKLCFANPTAIAAHRLTLYSARLAALEQKLLSMRPSPQKMSGSNIPVEQRLRELAKRIGFTRSAEDRAIGELKVKHFSLFTGPPSILSATSETATKGKIFRYTIKASNSPKSYNATNLPSEWQVHSVTGEITGVPQTPGFLVLTISAINDAGTGSANLNIQVAEAKPLITSPRKTAGVVRKPFFYQIAATNSPSRFAAGGLPSGLSLDSATGLIFGTPRMAGKTSVKIEAGNTGGTDDISLEIEIAPAQGWLAGFLRWLETIWARMQRLLAANPHPGQGRTVLKAAVALLALGALLLFVPFATTVKANLGIATKPARSMPVLFVRSPRVMEMSWRESGWKHLLGDTAPQKELQTLNDGNPDTGWHFHDRQGTHPLTADFERPAVFEGIVVLNGVRNGSSSRLKNIALRCDNGVQFPLDLADNGLWQVLLFDPVKTQRITIEGGAPVSVSAEFSGLAEVWFLEKFGDDPDSTRWEGEWIAEQNRLRLIRMKGPWFSGTFTREGRERRAYVRLMPIEIGGRPALQGSLAQGEQFVPDVEAQDIVIRGTGEALSVAIQRRSDQQAMEEYLLKR